MMGAPQVGCFSKCNRFTPCLVRPKSSESSERITELPDAVVAAAWSGGAAGFAQALSNLSKARGSIIRQVASRINLLRYVQLLRKNKLALRITGPLSDGFWVRVTIVLAHARWAHAAGLPVTVAYRSPNDNYDDSSSEDDGWQQYFEDIRGSWPHADVVQASCTAAAAIYKFGERPKSMHGTTRAAHYHAASGSYAWTWADAVEQRQWRRNVASQLPIRPRTKFVEAARSFWAAHGIERTSKEQSTRDAVIGIHLRGTDRVCRVEPQHYESLLRAFLCRWPNARIVAASDDTRMIDALDLVLRRIPVWPPSSGNASDRLITRAALRGRSRYEGKGLNPGVHAKSLPGFVKHIQKGDPSGYQQPHNATVAAQLGADILIDTLILSQCDYLLGSVSAVTSYAVMLNPRLHEHSFIWDMLGHPAPNWIDACNAHDGASPAESPTGPWDADERTSHSPPPPPADTTLLSTNLSATPTGA